MKRSITIILFTLLILDNTFSQDIVDTTFGIDGMVTTDIYYNSGDWLREIELLNDNKILAAGSTHQADTRLAILRYCSNGDIDSTFGVNGIVKKVIGLSSEIQDMKILPDSSIIALGTACMSDYYRHSFLLIKYNYNGSIDSTFGNNGYVITDPGQDDDIGRSMIIQEDGKILTAGESHSGAGSNYDICLIRYEEDGSLDSTFGENGIVTTDPFSTIDELKELAIQNDKIIILSNTGLVRYNMDGSLDLSFGQSGILEVSEVYLPSALGIQSDDKILVGGRECFMVRYNQDGTIDNSFGEDGIAAYYSNYVEYPCEVRFQNNGSIIVGSTAWIYPGVWRYFMLTKFFSNGAIDSTFGNQGFLKTDFMHYDNSYDFELYNNGNIIQSGAIGSQTKDFALVRYKSNLLISTTDNNIKKIKLYPNPAHNRINVIVPESNKLQYKIIDINGKVMQKGIIYNSTTIEIDASVRSGLYFVIIRCGQKTYINKIVINKNCI